MFIDPSTVVLAQAPWMPTKETPIIPVAVDGESALVFRRNVLYCTDTAWEPTLRVLILSRSFTTSFGFRPGIPRRTVQGTT